MLTRGDGPDLEAYVVERSPALRFYGGYWAFPGGAVDPELDAADDATDARQRERCAARELFEEVGVLLGGSAGSVGETVRAALRRSLVTLAPDDVRAEWGTTAQAAGLEAALPRAFARVLTPPFSLRRYDTSFHHARLPEGELPAVDGEEAVQGRFFRPAELLERWRRGELFVVPPTLHLLEHLARHGLEAGLDAAGRSSRAIAAGRPFGACQSPGILVLPLRTPTIPPATTTNTFLVGSEHVWIVDPATPEVEEQERLFALCEEIAEEGRRLAGILLTHHHRDHVGAAVPLARRFGLAVHAHPATHARVRLEELERRELYDGDELPLGTAPDGMANWTLRALFTPGHAPGHLAFVESYLRGAIVGDLASTLSTIVIDPPEGHMATYLASLQRLVEERIRILHPAHGLPTRGGVAVVEELIAHRARREARIVSALGATVRSIPELVAEVYADTPARMHGLARRSLLAGLVKLEEERRAARRAAGWVRLGASA